MVGDSVGGFAARKARQMKGARHGLIRTNVGHRVDTERPFDIDLASDNLGKPSKIDVLRGVGWRTRRDSNPGS
jgi:hypothetical protein